MEFWGVAVKGRQSFHVKIGERGFVNLSRASLGSEAQEPVIVYLTVKKKKQLLATLNPMLLPEEELNLTFVQDFEISHNLRNGSVFFFGSKNKHTPKKEEGSNVEKARVAAYFNKEGVSGLLLIGVFGYIREVFH
ncbi:unnamed protein product [Lactuca virosa]|uniref:Nucleoplasmin-like domain-containing protein n=1 Tax=Lactuca virosa TaxID=75947 RepID=A0AAU9M8D5_9ASTR|nr:unnamed protein product [Lactuca virosa]